MRKVKSFQEFIDQVQRDPQLQQELKEDPVKALSELTFSDPAYMRDKLVYRMVIAGFVGVLVLGVVYFIYQYQHSLDLRVRYSEQVLRTLGAATDPTAVQKLKDAIAAPTGLNGTTPDGIIAVFTAIIGALAGLFAPSPLSRSQGGNAS